MEKFVKYFMLVLMVSAMVLAGCSKSDDDEETPTPTPTPSYEVLKNYMVANGLDTDVVIAGWITDAASVNGKGTDAYHIIDIRSADAYNAGHIEGAVNSTLGGILTAAEGAGADTPEQLDERAQEAGVLENVMQQGNAATAQPPKMPGEFPPTSQTMNRGSATGQNHREAGPAAEPTAAREAWVRHS